MRPIRRRSLNPSIEPPTAPKRRMGRAWVEPV
jgi:hypothetical protein